MAGSVLRLTIVVVFSTLVDYTVLQRPESIIQNPFKLQTNFMKIANEKVSPLSVKRYRKTRPSNITEQLLWLEEVIQGSSGLVKRKVASPLLENPKVQNFLRRKISQRRTTNANRGQKDYLQKLIQLTTSNETSFSEVTVNSRNVSIATNNNSKTPSSESTAKMNSASFKKSKRLPLDKRKPSLKQTTQLKDNDKKNDEEKGGSLLGLFISTLTQLPIIGNVLKASVDPLYRPIVRSLQSVEAAQEHIMEGEQEMKNWCFGVLGCIMPTIDFYHPLYRPVNLPPYPREQIATTFTIYSRETIEGYGIPTGDIEFINATMFDPTRPTKVIIHGFFNDRKETWILEMVRAFLIHGDYNIITVDWSSGSYALYSQAVANIRVVALETVQLLKYLIEIYSYNPASIHIIGHSLGAHTAGYVGMNIKGIGRITGLDPAEPYFQYMPPSVRLDPTDANFVDIIHTDINSFFSLAGPRGFGLKQAVGHVDFYPNGGKEQPGCNQLLVTLPWTLVSEGADIFEGIKASQAEIFNCDHVRAPKLFTDSLTSDCPYLGFSCPSYESYKEGKCFRCGTNSENCASMGINAENWHRGEQTMVKMYLDTHLAPNFCKYHYLLTIFFNDTSFSAGTLRGKLKVSLITEDGNLRKFDLTALSPLKFPRRGSRTFMLEHYEDLSESREALLNWTFESDLLDPFTFCIIFCKADLSVSSVTLTSIDTPKAADMMVKMQSKGLLLIDEVIMCHKNGDEVISIPSEATIKVAASPSCPNRRTFKQNKA